MAGVLRLLGTAGLVIVCTISQGHAQAVNWGLEGTGDWESPGNWVEAGPPLTQFGEFAVISLENGGTAFIDGNSADTGGIVLGSNGGETGGLEVRSGGSITVVSNPNLPTSGAVSVGNGGTGRLTVFRGGSLTTSGLDTAGEDGSLLTLGEGSSGTATLTVNGLTELDRTTRIIGPNVAFTTQELALGTANTLIGEVTGLPHSTIGVSGEAILRGTLQLDFNGHSPQAGDFWDIIDAGSISGAFASAQPGPGDELATGLGLIVTTVSGGTNGNLARVSVGSKLVLTVDRNTGQVTMANPSGGSIDFDGYEIASTAGALTTANWNSLQDMSEPGWLEIGAPAPGLVAELNPNDSTVVNGATSFDLGNFYQFSPSALGETDDVTFRYSLASGEVVDGIVNLEGPENNLVLVVDPTTGDGVLQNQSSFTIGIDGYEVASASGSLNPGGWSSLADNLGESGWFEIGSPTSGLLAELNPDGSRILSSGAQLPLGGLFTAASTEDLTLRFSLDTGEVMSGLVQYGALPPPVSADFNADTFINGLDLAIWEEGYGRFAGNAQRSDGDANNDGFVLGGDFLTWQRQADSGGNAAAVPEPTSGVVLCTSLLAVLLGVRRRR